MVYFENQNSGASASVLKLNTNHNGNPGNSNVYVEFTDAGGSLDTIRGDASGGVETTMAIASDSRIKENVADLTGGLDKINALHPVSYNYTDDYNYIYIYIYNVKW